MGEGGGTAIELQRSSDEVESRSRVFRGGVLAVPLGPGHVANLVVTESCKPVC